jgi:hypothetical protein
MRLSSQAESLMVIGKSKDCDPRWTALGLHDAVLHTASHSDTPLWLNCSRYARY